MKLLLNAETVFGCVCVFSSTGKYLAGGLPDFVTLQINAKVIKKEKENKLRMQADWTERLLRGKRE